MIGWFAAVLLALAVAFTAALWLVIFLMAKEIQNRGSGTMHDGVESLL